jgi:hypothetical protein
MSKQVMKPDERGGVRRKSTPNRSAVEEESLVTELNSRLSQLAHQLCEISAELASERSERRARMMTLERVITDSPGPRLPAVERRIKQMPSPIVSVIVPTRNRGHTIEDAIVSVQEQHFTDWELIIVDDGSADDTATIVRRHLADNRIRYVERPAAGVSAARNQGFKLARGSLIAHLDSDNIWYPHFLTAAVTEFSNDPDVNVVYGILVTEEHGLDGTRLLWRPFDRDQLLIGNYIDINVIVHRRNMVERYGAFDERLSRLSDWDLVLRYTEHAPARALPVLAARYRICDNFRITATMPLGPELQVIRRKWPRRRHDPGARH